MIKLLLVEDDVNLRYIVQTGLQEIIGGYEVTVAENGKEGIEAWKKWKPDIIISDIDMPVMNGFEMVKRIRETDGETPILFASALTSPKIVNIQNPYLQMGKSLLYRQGTYPISPPY